MKPTMAQLEQSFEATNYRSRSHRVRSLVKSNEEHRVVRVWNPFSWLRFAGGHNASSGYDLPEENETGVSSQPYLPARSSRSSLRAVRTQMELQR